jgi:signal transduction histidine kinase
MRSHLDSYGPDGLVCVDGSGTVLGWNEALPRVLSCEPDRWVLRAVSDLFGWDTAEFRDALITGATEQGTVRLSAPINRDVGSFPAELTCSQVAPDGQPRCFFIYVRNDTDRARSGRDRMELELQNRLLMTRAGGLILVIDSSSGGILHANAQAEEYLRSPISRLRGRAIGDVMEEAEAFVSEGGLAIFRESTRNEIELTIPSAAGTPWVLLMNCTRIAWHGREALQWVGRDVTDRRASAPTLGSGVSLPLSAVTPTSEALRHPAAQIELLTRHCLERPDRPWHEMRSRLEQIQALGDQIRSTAEDLLYLARVASGSLDVRRTETSVGTVLGALLPRLQDRARSKGTEIHAVHVDEDAPLFVDARLLLHALRQFVLRAIEAGSTTVTLTATQEGDCVRFVIIDVGATMSAQDVARLLADDTLAMVSGDAGAQSENLPLMLAAHLFRVLGGHIEIQSSPGMGTRLSLTLLS